MRTRTRSKLLPPTRKSLGLTLTSVKMLDSERAALMELCTLIGGEEDDGRATVSTALRLAVAGELERRRAQAKPTRIKAKIAAKFAARKAARRPEVRARGELETV